MGIEVWIGEFEVEASLVFSNPALAASILVSILAIILVVLLIKALNERD